jgi:hypothetical protein
MSVASLSSSVGDLRIEKMKPSPNDRRVCVIVRDFLVGLAVFFAIFTLAMLDSRASRSAPAVVSMPAMTVQSAALSPANVTGKSSGKSWKRALALPSAVNSKDIAKIRARQKIASLEARRYAGLHRQQDTSAMPAAKMSRLALKSADRGMGSLPAAHAPSRLDRTWLITVMALLFAAMTAITLGLWRHLRSSVAPKRTRRKIP